MAKITRPQREINEQQKHPAYVCIANDLRFNPPIAHRHTSPKKNYVTQFEFGVAMAAVAAAMTKRRELAHKQARAYSGTALDRKRQVMQDTKKRRALGFKTRPPFEDYEVECALGGAISAGDRAPVKKIFRQTGQAKYQRRFRELLKEAPPIVTVRRTPSALLVSVGLRSNGSGHRRLLKALDRLLSPIADWPPVLTSWERLEDGRLRLGVCGDWIALRGGYKQLPLPLPLHSPTELALYLFSTALHVDHANSKSSSLLSLFARLGVAAKRRGATELFAQLGQAIAGINKYLTKLDHAQLERNDLLDVVPSSLDLLPVKGGHVRLVAIPRHENERAEVEEDIELYRRELARKYKRKPERELKPDPFPNKYDRRKDPEYMSEWQRRQLPGKYAGLDDYGEIPEKPPKLKVSTAEVDAKLAELARVWRELRNA